MIAITGSELLRRYQTTGTGMGWKVPSIGEILWPGDDASNYI